MRNFWNTFFSSKFSMLLLFVFILVIATATFIENMYDTTTVRLLIFNTWWFELLLLMLIFLYVLQVFRKKLFYSFKLPQLVFHVSFVVILLGAGITRYFGFEANMHIFEGERQSTLYTLEPYLQIRTSNPDTVYVSEDPLYFSQIEDNNFQLSFQIPEPLTIRYKGYIPNAMQVMDHDSGVISYQPNDTDEKNPSVLTVQIEYGGSITDVDLVYDKIKYNQKFERVHFGELAIEVAYGPKTFEIPFALQLEDFTLHKYPGSRFPSSSESRVLLIDDRVNFKEPHLIFKNNVLDYDGYRFFQTSYDDDEKGTILSVNYDFYGTRITYLGYLLIVLGILMLYFSRNSHFSFLDRKIQETRAERKALTLGLIFFLSLPTMSFAQEIVHKPVSKDHADRFGHLVVQNFDGRFSPVHSLALDIVHKITGKNSIYTKEKGAMDAMQVFMDMQVDPEYWRTQKMIAVRNSSLQGIIGMEGKYASFNDINHPQRVNKIKDLATKAFQKRASEQTKFDKELIKVVERMNIFQITTKGTFLRLFPHEGSINHKWVSWNDSLAQTPITGPLAKINQELELDVFNSNNLMRTYLLSLSTARDMNDYTYPDKIIGHISHVQRQLTPKEILPSEGKIALEVIYNKSRIFDHLTYIYALLGLLLLVLTIIDNFKSNSPKWLRTAIIMGIGMFATVFVVQSLGMVLRWHLSGHAPWSNGYEVLLFVAWSVVFAGFTVIKHSKITLAATGLTTGILLMVSGLSYYDPQLTNLTPVLKSYWLIIHVAIITIGYSFLAVSFMLGLINIVLYIVTTKKKARLFGLVIRELTFINEKLLTIGMFLTLIGTFLGGVWANESWGRYWGWDPKETWSLIIVLVYGVVLHFKYIPGLQSPLAFNIGSMLSFSSVLMTFIGVNYYFTKGLHSYASDDPPIFPIWAWVSIMSLLILIASAAIKENYLKNKVLQN